MKRFFQLRCCPDTTHNEHEVNTESEHEVNTATIPTELELNPTVPTESDNEVNTTIPAYQVNRTVPTDATIPTEHEVNRTVPTDSTIPTEHEDNPTVTTEFEVNPLVPTQLEVNTASTEPEINPFVPTDNNSMVSFMNNFVNTPQNFIYVFPSGVETRLNLPFEMSVIQATCPNFRSGELYRNYLISTVFNTPNPLREEFSWNGSKDFDGGIIRKEQRYHEEHHLYKIHPTQWKYLDLHLKMIYIIWLRGLNTPNRSRFTWSQIESQCGESQKTLLRLLKEARKLFTEWYDINIPPKPRSKESLKREELRKKLNLPNRSTDWKDRGRLERQ